MPRIASTSEVKDADRVGRLFEEIIRRENQSSLADRIVADVAKAEQAPKTPNAVIQAMAYGASQSHSNPTLSSVGVLGKIIRQKRKNMRLTQQEFADITGVGRRFISELESGKPSLEFGRVLKVCHAAGIDLMVAVR